MRWQLYRQSIWEGPLGCHHPVSELNSSIYFLLTDSWVAKPLRMGFRIITDCRNQQYYYAGNHQWRRVNMQPTMSGSMDSLLMSSISQGSKVAANAFSLLPLLLIPLLKLGLPYFLVFLKSWQEFLLWCPSLKGSSKSLSSIFFTNVLLLRIPNLGSFRQFLFSLLPTILFFVFRSLRMVLFFDMLGRSTSVSFYD